MQPTGVGVVFLDCDREIGDRIVEGVEKRSARDIPWDGVRAGNLLCGRHGTRRNANGVSPKVSKAAVEGAGTSIKPVVSKDKSNRVLAS